MRTKKWLVIILVLLTVAYCGIAAAVYDHSASITVYCFADTPALSWAKRHGAVVSLLGDSEKARLNALETFTYTLEGSDCAITGYEGISTRLVIPEKIDGHRVTAVSEHTFDGCDSLQEIVLPKTLQDFSPLHTTKYALFVYAGSPAEQALKQAVSAKEQAEALKEAAEKAPAALEEAQQEAAKLETEASQAEAELRAAQENAAAEQEETSGAQTQIDALQKTTKEKREQADAAAKKAEDAQKEKDRLEQELRGVSQETFTVCDYSYLSDSEPVNFDNTDIPFTYSALDGGVTLVSYTGSSADIVVPETINGLPVTTVAFPVSEQTRSILLPPSVTKITSKLAQPRYDAPFWLNLTLVVLGLALALGMMQIAEKRGTGLDARFLGLPLIYSGVKYFVLLLLWAAACLAFGWTVMLQNAVGLGLVALSVVECILTLHAAERAEQVGAQIQEKAAFMQDCRKKAAALQARAGTQPMKDACARVSEALRYCDPVSGAELDSVEADMSAALHRLSRAVDTGDEAEAEKQAETILRLLDERAALQMRAK